MMPNNYRLGPGLMRQEGGRFLRDTRAGAVGIASVFIALMCFTGTALLSDHLLLVQNRHQLRSGTVSASIAATQRLAELDPDLTAEELVGVLEPLARRYILANLPESTRASASGTLEVTVLPDREAGVVGVEAAADLGGAIVGRHIWGRLIDKTRAATGAARTTNRIEVVLAIDVSRSMERALDGRPASYMVPSRMTIVKQAARDLVAILNPTAEGDVAMGVVPWHILVRLGDTARQEWRREGWAEYPSSRRYAAAYSCDDTPGCTSLDEIQALPADPGGEWQGCLDEHRVSLTGQADLPPVLGLFDLPSRSAFAQAIFQSLEGSSYKCLQSPLPDDINYQSCYGTADDDVKGLGRVYSETAAQRGCGVDPLGYYGESPVILPLTTDPAAIEAAVDSLEPVGFRTYSTLGVAWGQRLLSPAWKDVWGDDVHPVDPAVAANAGTRKAIVLLTDGEDNQCGFQDPSCSSNDVGFARGVACTAAKAAGTEIFVITAMHPDNVSSSHGRALRACSSEADDPRGTYVFFNNSDPETLRAAFADIARQLGTIRRLYYH